MLTLATINRLATVLVLVASLFTGVPTAQAADTACIEWEFLDPAGDYVIRLSGYVRVPVSEELPKELVLKTSPDDKWGSVALTDLRIDESFPVGARISGNIQVLGTEDKPYPAVGGQMFPLESRDFWTLWLSSQDTSYYIFLRKNPPSGNPGPCTTH